MNRYMCRFSDAQNFEHQQEDGSFITNQHQAISLIQANSSLTFNCNSLEVGRILKKKSKDDFLFSKWISFKAEGIQSHQVIFFL